MSNILLLLIQYIKLYCIKSGVTAEKALTSVEGLYFCSAHEAKAFCSTFGHWTESTLVWDVLMWPPGNYHKPDIKNCRKKWASDHCKLCDCSALTLSGLWVLVEFLQLMLLSRRLPLRSSRDSSSLKWGCVYVTLVSYTALRVTCVHSKDLCDSWLR